MKTKMKKIKKNEKKMKKNEKKWKKMQKMKKKWKIMKKREKNEVLAHVMVLACDGWRRGSHGLSARRAWRTKSSRPEGPPARSRAPEGP